MTRFATNHSADVERLLRALGIDATKGTILTVDIALRPNSLVVLTVEHAITEDQLAALVDELESHPLQDRERK